MRDKQANRRIRLLLAGFVLVFAAVFGGITFVVWVGARSVLAGDMSYGDEPDGYGYQMLKKAFAWRRATGGVVEASPAAAKGLVLAGSSDGHVYAIEAALRGAEVVALDARTGKAIWERVAYEGELALVIGRSARAVPPEQALSHIFGFTCANDVTALELLNRDASFAQWTRAKSFDTFGVFVEWVPVCPEVELGLGTPRESLRLVRKGDLVHMVNTKSGRDISVEMRRWARARVEALAGEHLAGYVLKKDSPSCGMERVKVYGESGMADKSGRGFFAEALPLVGLVFLVVAGEEHGLRLALEGEDVGGDAVEEPAVVRDDEHAAGEFQ